MKHVVLTLMATCGLLGSCKAQKKVNVLEPVEFIAAAKADTTAVLLDVRKPTEFAEGHIENAINIDWLDKELFNDKLQSLDKNHTYYIYCRSGRRSNDAAMSMQEKGYKVFDMSGGVQKWKALGMPLAK